MKVERRAGARPDQKQIREDLEPLRNNAEAAPPCAATCPQGLGPYCSPNCPDVPRLLSSDPDKHPLEPLIAPLVYELQRLAVFQPCWSCEGHNDQAGTLWKLPRVWFYADSLVHVRALADAIKGLDIRGRLNTPWQVVLVSHDPDNPDCSFSLEPAPSPDLTLAKLHADIGVLVAELNSVIGRTAMDLTRRIAT